MQVCPINVRHAMTRSRGTEERWQTPVSDAGSLAMVSLLDQGGLHITVQDLKDPARRRYQFSFRDVPAYRNILEEYRMSEPPPAGAWAGWTRIDPRSAWLADLSAREPLLDVHRPGCVHYIIVTEDDVIDVLSPEVPAIVEIAPAASDEPAPGKSQVLYDPQDRQQIARLLDDARRRRDDA